MKSQWQQQHACMTCEFADMKGCAPKISTRPYTFGQSLPAVLAIRTRRPFPRFGRIQGYSPKHYREVRTRAPTRRAVDHITLEGVSTDSFLACVLKRAPHSVPHTNKNAPSAQRTDKLHFAKRSTNSTKVSATQLKVRHVRHGTKSSSAKVRGQPSRRERHTPTRATRLQEAHDGTSKPEKALFARSASAIGRLRNKCTTKESCVKRKHTGGGWTL